MIAHLKFRDCGSLLGHEHRVTAIAEVPTSDFPATRRIITGSQDSSLILWDLKTQGAMEDGLDLVGEVLLRMNGHTARIEDVAVTPDGRFAVTASQDNTIGCWDLNTGSLLQTLQGHERDVLSVDISHDGTQIASSSKDKTVKTWTTDGQCTLTLGPKEDGHNDWVSRVRFVPGSESTKLASCGWDARVKVWDLANNKLEKECTECKGCITSLAISANGSLFAFGGKDCLVILWDYTEKKSLQTVEAWDLIHALQFSPNQSTVCASTQSSIRMWSVDNLSLLSDVRPLINNDHSPPRKIIVPYGVSLQWSRDDHYIFGGYTDGVVRIWEKQEEGAQGEGANGAAAEDVVML